MGMDFMGYVAKEYWENKWKGRNVIPNKSDSIVGLIQKYIPDGTGTEEAFEIGCGSCGYLAYVGKRKNYVINGIDYADTIDESLIDWLSGQNLKLGEIRKGNFFGYVPKKKCDFVFSLGFVEHFDNFRRVIRMHDKYVKKNGYLLITAPNYRGIINHIWNGLFNPIMMGRHNLASMRPDLWASILEEKGYSIVWKGYFGGFVLWNSDPEESRSKAKNFVMRAVCRVIKNNADIKSSGFYSPYCGVVARKKSE